MGAKFSSGGGATVFYDKTDTPGEIVRELVNASDGAGLHFDGAAGYIDIASPPDLGTKLSFEFVCKVDDPSGTQNGLLVDFGGGSGRAIFGASSSISGNFGIYYNSAWATFGLNPLTDGSVHHLIASIDGTTATLYDNGNQIATATIGSLNIDGCTDARIGTNFVATGGFFGGTIYRARFYNKALTSAEVQTAYERADVPVADQYGSQTSLVDAAASVFTSGTYSWVAYGSNTIANVGNALEITYGNAANGAYNYFRNASDLTTDLIVGKKYRLTVDAKYTGGSAGSTLVIGSVGTAFATLTTSMVTYTTEFTATQATTDNLRCGGMSAGNVVTIDNWYLREIGCVTDYDLAYAQPALSTLIQDRSNSADGVASSTGVTQVQPITQLNSTSARIGSTQLAAGTAPYIPADGSIVADKVGAGVAPAAPLHAKVAASTGTSPLEVARLEVKDEGVNMAAGMGPKLTFYTPHTDASFEGASIAAKKENADDFNEATTLAFSTCPDAGTNTERLTISSTGQALFSGSKVTINTDGTIDWGNAADAGRLTWDTNDAKIRGVAGKNLKLGADNTDFVTIDTGGLCTFSGGINLGNSTLSNYEQGTFTATLNGGTAEPATLVTATANYTRVGDRVFFSIGFEGVDTTGYSGAITISGLPFANAGVVRSPISVITYDSATWTSGSQAAAFIGRNHSYVSMYAFESGGVWNALQHDAGTGRYFWLNGTYKTAAA